MIGKKQIQRAVTTARNIAVQDKHKRTYLKRDESNPVYNTNTTTSQRIRAWFSNFTNTVLKGAGYSDKEIFGGDVEPPKAKKIIKK